MAYRAVLDTDVLIAAVLSATGASAELLLLNEEGVFEVAWSDPLIEEIRMALLSLTLRAKYSYTDEDVHLAIAALQRFGKRAAIQGHADLADDPGDNKVVETVLRARARYLVTFSARHFKRGRAAVALARAGVSVLPPAAFLHVVRGAPRPIRRRGPRR